MSNQARASPAVRSIGSESSKPPLDSFYGNQGLVSAPTGFLLGWRIVREVGVAAQRPSKCRLWGLQIGPSWNAAFYVEYHIIRAVVSDLVQGSSCFVDLKLEAKLDLPQFLRPWKTLGTP